MPQSEARAWWANFVQDVRETIERRRAAERAARPRADAPPRRRRQRRGVRGARPIRPSAAGAGPTPVARCTSPRQPAPASGRRTVEITGRPATAPPVAASVRAAEREAGGAPGELGPPSRAARRRPSPSPAERLAHRPDRIAAWAAVLGFAMMVIAAL